MLAPVTKADFFLKYPATMYVSYDYVQISPVATRGIAAVIICCCCFKSMVKMEYDVIRS